jgi:flagellin FlaB
MSIIRRKTYMKGLIKNEDAQAGVGTLIIFIAMVLVAAVAAAVLMQTSGVMQSKSATTTKEAAAAIGENIAVEAVDGNKATGSSTTLLNLNVTIKIQAGGSDIDLSKVLVKVNAQNYNYSTYSTNGTPNTFVVYSLRDPGNTDLSGSGINSFSAKSNPTLKSGALARLDINISSLSIGARNDITLAMTPEKGATVNLPLTTPALGSTTSVAIYP